MRAPLILRKELFTAMPALDQIIHFNSCVLDTILCRRRFKEKPRKDIGPRADRHGIFHDVIAAVPFPIAPTCRFWHDAEALVFDSRMIFHEDMSDFDAHKNPQKNRPRTAARPRQARSAYCTVSFFAWDASFFGKVSINMPFSSLACAAASSTSVGSVKLRA
jgi:hypothetical protein